LKLISSNLLTREGGSREGSEKSLGIFDLNRRGAPKVGIDSRSGGSRLKFSTSGRASNGLNEN